MKLTIHSIGELKELVHLLAYGLAPRADGPRLADATSPYVATLVAAATTAGERIDGCPTALAEPYTPPTPVDEPRAEILEGLATFERELRAATGNVEALAGAIAKHQNLIAAATPEELTLANAGANADEPIEATAAELALAEARVAGVVTDEPKAEMVDVDSRNIPWDERIHAGTQAKNADGTWRARRGVSPELVEQVERELMGELTPRTAGERAEQREADDTAAESAAEAVALQIQDLDTDRPVDYPAIIKRAEVVALDLSGDHRALMVAAQGFIGEYGHDAFNALRAAAVPDENGVGKAVQLLSPGERRLLEACIAEYAK